MGWSAVDRMYHLFVWQQSDTCFCTILMTWATGGKKDAVKQQSDRHASHFVFWGISVVVFFFLRYDVSPASERMIDPAELNFFPLDPEVLHAPRWY